MSLDFNAHKSLSGTTAELDQAIRSATEKSDLGNFSVCYDNAGSVLVLSDYALRVRDDISRVVFTSDNGFNFNNTEH